MVRSQPVPRGQQPTLGVDEVIAFGVTHQREGMEEHRVDLDGVGVEPADLPHRLETARGLQRLATSQQVVASQRAVRE